MDNQGAENRGSQNLLRPLRAENGSPDRFHGAARRRANSRASTRKTKQVGKTGLLFCYYSRIGESNSACIARVTKRASGTFRRARAPRVDASKPRGCAQRIRRLILRASTTIYQAGSATDLPFLLLHAANQGTENRGSQNRLRPLRAENDSPDRFHGAARRRANSRASTTIYQADSATDLPFCCEQSREPSCRKM